MKAARVSDLPPCAAGLSSGKRESLAATSASPARAAVANASRILSSASGGRGIAPDWAQPGEAVTAQASTSAADKAAATRFFIRPPSLGRMHLDTQTNITIRDVTEC